MAAPEIAAPFLHPAPDVVQAVSGGVLHDAILGGTKYTPPRFGLREAFETETPPEQVRAEPVETSNFAWRVEYLPENEQVQRIMERWAFLISNGAYQQLVDEFEPLLKLFQKPTALHWNILRAIASAHQRLIWTATDEHSAQIHAQAAKERLHEALDVAQKIDDFALEIPVRNSLVAVYGSLGDIKSARVETNRVLMLFSRVRRERRPMGRDYTRSYALALQHKAREALELDGNVDEALKGHRESIKVLSLLHPFHPVMDAPVIANAHASLGAILRDHGDTLLAADSFLDATETLGPHEEIARRPEEWTQMFLWTLEAARLFVEAGAPLRALEPYRLAAAMSEFLDDQETLARLREEVAAAERGAAEQPRSRHVPPGEPTPEAESRLLEVAPPEREFSFSGPRVKPKKGLVSTLVRETRDRRGTRL